MIQPIFHTNHSLRSILTLEQAGLSDESTSPSIFDCAKDLRLKNIVIIDDNPSSFVPAFNRCLSQGFNLVYGLRFIVCNDVLDSSDESLSSHARYNLIAKTGRAYKNILQRLFTLSNTAYLVKIGNTLYPRLDFKVISSLWDDEMILMPCFYDGPVYQNLFSFCSHEFDFPSCTPLFEIQRQNLPFDAILTDSVLSYAHTMNAQVLQTHSVYYRKRSEFAAFLTYRAIKNHKYGKSCTFQAPNLQAMHSNTFCAEHLIGAKIYE
jgi:DNA polymerase III alpha subunit